MAKSNYVYLSGDAMGVGSHGDTNYVYHSGDPVPNIGGSVYVFESGSGVGLGGLQYEVNGGGLQTLEPIATAESHSDFYDYRNNSAHHGYEEAGVVTLFVHENTNDGSYAIIQTAGKEGVVEPSRCYEMFYSTTINAGSDYLVLDGENTDEFGNDYSLNGWNGNATDGWAIDGDAVTDITFTFANGDRHPIGSGDPSNVRVITKDGSTPNGGGTVYAGFPNGSVRFVTP